jgi:tRNA-splicing ligase RtcB
VRRTLEKRGIRVLSAGSDEVPGVYKNIEQVMAEQSDLVEAVARFDPKIVKCAATEAGLKTDCDLKNDI